VAAQTYLSHCPEPYQSELHLQQQAFIRSISERMEKAVMIIFDYGFDAQEYYLPQRSMGTMMAYYHHHSLHDPFFF
jgi:SAM-dependent MidA family methyltransferase